MKRTRSRREFLQTTGRAGAGLLLAGAAGCSRLGSRVPARRTSPNEKLNVACIGIGGRGAADLRGVSGENIVALCDVDEHRAATTLRKYPDVPFYHDFRVMLEKQKEIDAVVVATPDHMHAPAAVMAMKMGKHVYCEKPLARSIGEARLMAETARRMGVATQMGIQGHSFDGHRRAVELVRAGVIGAVRAVHVWSDRPIWPQAIERPAESEPVPKTLNWDLWLGPAPWRPYHHIYLPFNWRGWYDFGSGALGDMGCHNMDVAFWSLRLGAPTSCEAEVSGVHKETYPKWSIVRWEFPARASLPPVKLTWYDGGKKPPAEIAQGVKLPTNGALLMGEKGTLLAPDWHANNFRLLPEEKFKDLEGPKQTIPRAPGQRDTKHHKEWIAACKGGPPALANFDYAGPMTEAVLLGNVALRLGKRIEWDSKKMKAIGSPEADAIIRPEYRRMWTL